MHRIGVLADRPAARAGQVAGVQRFEHQHQGKPLVAGESLLQQVSGQEVVSESGNRTV